MEQTLVLLEEYPTTASMDGLLLGLTWTIAAVAGARRLFIRKWQVAGVFVSILAVLLVIGTINQARRVYRDHNPNEVHMTLTDTSLTLFADGRQREPVTLKRGAVSMMTIGRHSGGTDAVLLWSDHGIYTVNVASGQLDFLTETLGRVLDLEPPAPAKGWLYKGPPS